MKKKKILFASYNLDIGGIEKSLITLLNNMDFTKYDITLVLERKEGILLNKINQNIKIIEYRVSNNNNIILRKLTNLFKRISFIINNYHKYDFSCCYATYSKPANIISLVSSKNNSIYIHSNYKYLYNNYDLIKFFNERNIEKFKHVIFVSNEAKNDLIRFFPTLKNKSLVINNLVNYKEIELLSKEVIKEKKSLEKLFVFIGRLDEESKRVSKLINVIKNIPEIELWIIGDGPSRQDYQNMIVNYPNIKMLGAKLNPYPYIKEADYIILTSDYEGFPVVYNEAIVMGKKILTTIDVSDDYISIANRFGFIISKDPKEMEKDVKNILKNDKLIPEKVDYKKINEKRIKMIENIIDEVI